MAQTLIGRLRLLIEAQGLGNAKKVQDALRGIDGEARRLSSAPWGIGFQRQLDKLRLSGQDIDRIRGSWTRLNETIRNGNLKGALKTNEIMAWKQATLGAFAAVEARADRAHARVQRLTDLLKSVGKVGLVSAGAYTATYGAGLATTAALRAGSEERRVMANARFAGLSDAERGTITKRSEELSTRYRLSKAEALDMLKETGLSFPSVDHAVQVSDSNARAQLLLDSMFGSGAGVSGVRAFAKSMDLLERLDPAQYTKMLDNYVRAQQVLGKDIDPQAFYQAAKYSRTGGKVGSDEFMSLWLPMLISEVGGPNAGTMVRAGFDQFVVGRATKKALKAQTAYGVRGKDGKLVNETAFGENPIKWMQDTLLPLLDKKGVNLDDKVELARVLGEITSNRLASDEAAGALLNMFQQRRYIEKRFPQAAGLSAADQVQNLDPFAAWAGFKDSVSNLAAAVMPMQVITDGLNSFADGINAFVQKIRDGDPMIKYGVMGAAGVAGIAGVWMFGKAVGGLIFAGANLNAAAFALQAAAVAQGGGSIGDIGRKSGRLSGLAKTGAWGAAAAVVAGGIQQFISQTSSNVAAQNRSRPMPTPWHGIGVNRGRADVDPNGQRYESGMHRVYSTGNALPGEKINIDPNIVADAERIGAQVKSALSPTASPTVDTSAIDVAIAKAQQLRSLLGGIASAAYKASSAIDEQMRRAHADYGVAP